MEEDNEYEVRLADYRKRCTYVTSFSGFVKELLESPLPYSWRILDQLIVTAAQDSRHMSELRNQIELSVRLVKSFPMLIYLYSLKQTRRDFTFRHVYWRSEYEEVAFQLGDLSIFTSWVSSNHQCRIVAETLWLVVRMFPTFSRNEAINFGQAEVQNIIQWMAYFHTPEPDTDKFSHACELIKVAKETRFTTPITQHHLLKKLIEIVCQVKQASSNVFLFLYPMPLMEQQITYFCEIYSDFLSDLSEEGICTLFEALTKGAVSKQTLLIVQKISYILANEEEFFKLRYLYQKFILPIIAKRAKACPRVQDLAYDITEHYVLGFLKHCDIGPEGVVCLTRNISKVIQEHIQSKWIQLCITVCNWYPELKTQVEKALTAQMRRPIQCNQIGSYLQEEQDCVWNVTLRNGRKHKKYLKVPSRMRGILNTKNECYIISTVHGLQKTNYLQLLLQKYKQAIKGRFKLLDELRILFNEISGHRKAQKIQVKYLKKVSPEQFVRSEHQEDAYQYLIKILDLIEIQMNNIPGITPQFKSIFQIEEISTLFCSSCHQEKETLNKAYVHTISNTVILSQFSQEQLSGFSCPKCGTLDSCVMKSKLNPKSKIIIVHINRFSSNIDGTIKKQLSTQRILRKFLNYELSGMICHKGKKAQRGHYVYYHCISSKRWALFNDNLVEQFELDQPFQQFQREWKSQMTPYILIYKQKNVQ